MSAPPNHRTVPLTITAGNSRPAGGPALAPRGRPRWPGLPRFSLVAVPVKAYPAASSNNPSHFHLLHADCRQRIQYQKRCPHHGPVESDAIVRGFEYAPDHRVVVEPEELDQLRPARDKALLLEQFVPVQEVDPTFFAGRSLYLVPDGPAAQHPYGVLVEALQQAGQAALGRVVLSSHRQLVLLRPSGRFLVLGGLHHSPPGRSAAPRGGGLPALPATGGPPRAGPPIFPLGRAPLGPSP